MPEDTIVYVFQDNHGKWIATVDKEEAETFVTPALRHQTIERMTLGELYARDPHALVRARAQYYWASDLLTGTARGAVI
ncbi:MAG: hypothetical protein H5T69_10110 [Chloroflexi bacterium]|nr:hypothetical protein [Chloroflexota bacterium]